MCTASEPSALLPLGDEDAFYCGCFREPGHYVFGANMAKVSGTRERTLGEKLDSARWYPRAERQGEAKLTRLGGWTILGFADRSVDSRPGSHSTFALRGDHDFITALALAKATFPHVFERFDFEVQFGEESDERPVSA